MTTIHASCIDELTAALGADRVQTGDDIRRLHGTDSSFHPPALPDAVVFPETVDECLAIVRTCIRHDTPMVPFGAGSSLEGHIMALRGGVSIDMTRMNAITAPLGRGPRRDGPGRGHAAPARRAAAAGGRVLLRRPRRRRDDRRDDRDGRVGHDDRALRRDARERPVAAGRHARRRARADALAGAQVVGRLGPHAAVHRLGGHARPHLRGDAARASHAGGDVRGRAARSARWRTP